MLLINGAELGELSQEDSAKKMSEFDSERVIRVAVEGLKILIEQDREG